MAISLDFNVLQELTSPDSRALHHVSDSLSACGVKKSPNVPSIVVVGDRSSGKSSVLEAISCIRFPKEDAPCTQFATVFVFRPASKPRVRVTIKWADPSKPPKIFERTAFHEDDLADIIKEARELINFTPSGSKISRDVLSLEIDGPELHPLAMVDLPGLLDESKATEPSTDSKIVDDLLKNYVSMRKCIVLAVFGSGRELSRRLALEKLAEFDPAGDKTLGILAKADLTHPGDEDEITYRQSARNLDGSCRLKHGWHLICNGPDAHSDFDIRDKQEDEFFQTGAWATLSREDVGIASLRKKISRLLFDRVRCGLPDAIRSTEAKLKERQDSLQALGKVRSTPLEMRSFLIASAESFQHLARSALQGRYNDPFFGDIDLADRKLRAQIRNLNQLFHFVMVTKGHRHLVTRDLGFQPPTKVLPGHLQDLLNKHSYNFPEPQPITMTELKANLETQAPDNQAHEYPGLPNQNLVTQLFQWQATPWRKIAEYHVRRVMFVTRGFVDALIRHVTGSSAHSQTGDAILSIYVDPIFREKESMLQAKLEELLRPYSQGYATALDEGFYQAAAEKSTTRFVDNFYSALNPNSFESSPAQAVTRSQVIDAASSSTAQEGEFLTHRVIDMAHAYYSVSLLRVDASVDRSTDPGQACRRTFMENVINLAIESCLMSDIPTIFTPTLVNSMSSERVAELAIEPDAVKSQRRYLEEDIRILEQGLSKYRQFQPAITMGESCSTCIVYRGWS